MLYVMRCILTLLRSPDICFKHFCESNLLKKVTAFDAFCVCKRRQKLACVVDHCLGGAPFIRCFEKHSSELRTACTFTTRMPRLTLGVRWRIVSLKIDAGWSLREIAQHLHVILGVMVIVLRIFLSNFLKKRHAFQSHFQVINFKFQIEIETC